MNQPMFWMGGRLATDLVEISHEPSCLDDGDFWAVSTTFEGVFTAAKFATVVDSDFPDSSWSPIKSQWDSVPDQEGYISYVERIRELIAQGWVYQVNACRRLTTDDSNLNLRGSSRYLSRNTLCPGLSTIPPPEI